MKRFTRIAALLLALLMVFSLAACNKAPANTDTPANNDTPATNDNDTPANNDNDTDTPPADNDEPANNDEPVDTNAPQLPLVTEPVTVKFWWPTVEEMLEDAGYDKSDPYLYFQEMEKRTGVHVEIEVPDAADASTQFGLLMTSQDYPDFIENFSVHYGPGLDHAIEEELIVPLEDYQDIMPNFFNYINADSEIRKQSTTDEGHVAGIPFIKISMDGQAEKNWCGYAANGTWLKEQNLEVPTTYDEFANVLEVFKTNYSDTAPYPLKLMSMRGNFLNDFGQSFHGGYNFGSSWFVVDGKVNHGVLTEGWREFHRMISDWIAKGYIDSDFLAQANLWMDADDYTDRKFGIYNISYTNTIMYVTAAEKAGVDFDMVGIPQLRVDKDTPVHIGYTLDKATNKSCIMVNSENIELLCKWWDYFFTDEGILLANFGVEGKTFEYNANGEPEWILEAFTSDDPRWNNTHFQCAYLLFNAPGVVHFDRELSVQHPEAVKIHDVWINSYDTEYVYPTAAALNTAEQEKYTNIYTDLQTFINEQTVKFVTGELNYDTDWDAFIEQVKAMNIDECIELKQAAYDRYNAR